MHEEDDLPIPYMLTDIAWEALKEIDDSDLELDHNETPRCWCGLPVEQHVDAARDFRPRGD